MGCNIVSFSPVRKDVFHFFFFTDACAHCTSQICVLTFYFFIFVILIGFILILFLSLSVETLYRTTQLSGGIFSTLASALKYYKLEHKINQFIDLHIDENNIHDFKDVWLANQFEIHVNVIIRIKSNLLEGQASRETFIPGRKRAKENRTNMFHAFTYV